MTVKRIKTIGALALSAAVLLGCQATGQSPETSPTSDTLGKGEFTNPLFPNGADPWLEYWNGNYYLTTTTWTSQLVMRKAPTLAALADATPVNVWSDSDPKRNWNFWAFEFHRLKGPNGYRWYMMYTAGEEGTLDHQHLNVLESAGDDPMGPYEYKGALMPDVWNIDGNYLEFNDKLYVIYSQWQGDTQLNIIAEMENPWTLKENSPHTIITTPELEWEISGRKVTEGAEILQHQGRTFMTYSASFCDTPDYKLGLLELVGDDPLDINSWKKYDQPVFERTETVFGPGHNGFFQSPDGSESWIVYHGNDKAEYGCGATRSLRAQKFTWHSDGTPNFGKPVTPGDVMPPPAGEDGPLLTEVEGQNYAIVNANTRQCLDAGGSQNACNPSISKWVIDPTRDGYVRLADNNTKAFLGEQCDSPGLSHRAWINDACQEWKVERTRDGAVKMTNRLTGNVLADAEWLLQPQNEVVLLSEQSGKAVAVGAKDNVEQQAWRHGDNQKWRFRATDNGFLQIRPMNDTRKCLAVENEAIFPGANLTLASCDGFERREREIAEWRLDMKPSGAVVLVNRYTNQALNIDSCGVADGTNISQAPQNNGICQTFYLRQTK
ncbi:family 43 glycosylhydrolase [Neiella sp. HB171785]|uniref:Family 43 glycosylhydrolase n=1 Tax=Neiella litorisoli TaxID=2771431 RepID=A0A8J6QTP0_9GAMM|nr:family 43 glycosylhydrolase [Neiella litorisoli]MBD1389002.1 family 43 glycosylhydrolase [Neiella litorisoli]